MTRRPSLSDVAAAAAVAVGTVSNVLNNPERVRLKTREKVYRAMRELDYRPAVIRFPAELAPRRADAPKPESGTLPLLVSVGYISVDYTARIGVMPHRDDRITADRISKELGGPAANVAVAAAALGPPFALDVELVTAIGSDADSLWALEKLAERGVRSRAVRGPFKDRLSRCLVLVEEGGHRIKINEPLEMNEADLIANLPRNPIKRPSHLHFEGYQAEAILPAAAALREIGWRVSMHDTGLGPKFREPVEFTRLLDRLDLVFLNRRTVCELLGRRLATEQLFTGFGRFLAHQGCTADVVVTFGLEGAAVFPRSGSDAFRVPALAVDVVDGTGAGDCFVGTFLAQRLHQTDLESAARRAAIAASLSVSAEGAQGRRSSFGDINAHLTENVA